MRRHFAAWVVVRVSSCSTIYEGVLVPDIYDATLNPVYRDVLTHYGCVALPCRKKIPIAMSMRNALCGRSRSHAWTD